MKCILLFLSTFFIINNALAQPKGFQNTGFFADEIKQVCNGAAALSDDEVINLITTICEKTNNKNRFIIAPCTQVPNCYATVHNNRPYILYNTQFLATVKGLQFTNAKLPDGVVDWKVMTLLAHEIGHHIYMHLTNPDPNMNDREMELEADEFAGYAIYMLGGSLAQAQSVMYGSNISEKDSYTHPGRSKRIDAIAKGYNRGQSMFPKITEKILPVITESDAEVETELKAAEANYNKDDYAAAFPVYYKYSGHKLFTARQMLHIGWMYDNGKGTTVNYERAYEWYKKSAALGDAIAMNNIGVMYEFGNGVTQNYNTAVSWFQKGADAGAALPQLNLAEMYYYGKGVSKNSSTAFSLFKQSAQAGNSEAMLYVGDFYKLGISTTVDYSQAMQWYNKAINAGEPAGYWKVGIMYENGFGVTKDYVTAAAKYKQAADAGNDWGRTSLGHLHVNGNGVTKNYSTAADLYRKAAANGHSEAQANLGYLYLNGYGVPQDYSTAVKFFKQSAEQGHSLGQSNLGFMYEKGYGVDKDLDKAIGLYKKSAALGDSYAQDACKRLGITW